MFQKKVLGICVYESGANRIKCCGKLARKKKDVVPIGCLGNGRNLRERIKDLGLGLCRRTILGIVLGHKENRKNAECVEKIVDEWINEGSLVLYKEEYR